MTLRLKSALWVQAYLRRCNSNGNFGAILHRGAEEAGAVQVVLNRLDGNYDLLSPPPGSSYDEHGERQFIHEATAPRDWMSLNELLQRRRKRDPDLWIVEVECRNSFTELFIQSEV